MFKYCLICKKKFFKQPTDSLKNWNNRRKTCSLRCQHKWQESRIGWNKGLTVIDDPRVARFVEAGHKAHLGKDPWNKNKKGLQIAWNRGLKNPLWTKENNPNWKGGVTKENDKIRKSYKYRKWRKAIFLRDNYTCQLCGKRGEYMHADHIKPFAYYPKLRFELINGRTLCVPCHRKTNTYGNNIKKYTAGLTPK